MFQSRPGCSTSAVLIAMGDLLCHRLVPSCGRVRFGKNKELCMSSMLITRTLSWLVFAQDPSPTAGTTTMPFVAAYARYGLASKCGSGSSDACAAGRFNGRGTRGAPVILLPMFGTQWSSARFGWQHGVWNSLSAMSPTELETCIRRLIALGAPKATWPHCMFWVLHVSSSQLVGLNTVCLHWHGYFGFLIQGRHVMIIIMQGFLMEAYHK
jgi:hypothetical protein